MNMWICKNYRDALAERWEVWGFQIISQSQAYLQTQTQLCDKSFCMETSSAVNRTSKLVALPGSRHPWRSLAGSLCWAQTESCKSSNTVLPWKVWWVGKTNDQCNEASNLFPKADEASQFSGLFLMAFGWYPARIKALFSLTITKCAPYHMPS